MDSADFALYMAEYRLRAREHKRRDYLFARLMQEIHLAWRGEADPLDHYLLKLGETEPQDDEAISASIEAWARMMGGEER
ncbi:MAG: hypothetical protein RRC34_02910 [Lentisphaeria bacterium]|nr:hypothetical protein [Lentisphaeria bacterium]